MSFSSHVVEFCSVSAGMSPVVVCGDLSPGFQSFACLFVFVFVFKHVLVVDVVDGQNLHRDQGTFMYTFKILGLFLPTTFLLVIVKTYLNSAF